MLINKDFHITVTEEYDGMRVDKFISENLPNLSRSSVLNDDSEIYVNSNPVKKSFHVKTGQEVYLKYKSNVFMGIVPEKIKLNIIYEDDNILVINKEQGMVVHPGNGVNEGTLVNALAYRYGEKFINSFNEDAISRPGIVHRLDKDTSGVMVIALTQEALSKLSHEFSEHTNEKIYYAISEGFYTSMHGFIEGYINRNPKNRQTFILTKDRGKYSKTEYFVEKQFSDYALVKLKLYTGRTHQIRVHLKSINHGIIGDPIYNSGHNEYKTTLMLHSYLLKIKHPKTNEEMEFRANLPSRFDFFINSHLLNS